MLVDHGLTDRELEWVGRVEKSKNAKFIGCFPVGGYNGIAFCFYQAVKHPVGSHYFGLYEHPIKDCLMIIDAGKIDGKTFSAIKSNGRVIYSRYRHDYIEFGNSHVDGGWDYFKCSLGDGDDVITMSIKDGEINEADKKD